MNSPWDLHVLRFSKIGSDLRSFAQLMRNDRRSNSFKSGRQLLFDPSSFDSACNHACRQHADDLVAREHGHRKQALLCLETIELFALNEGVSLNEMPLASDLIYRR
jgi:hypothetical protein